MRAHIYIHDMAAVKSPPMHPFEAKVNAIWISREISPARRILGSNPQAKEKRAAAQTARIGGNPPVYSTLSNTR